MSSVILSCGAQPCLCSMNSASHLWIKNYLYKKKMAGQAFQFFLFFNVWPLTVIRRYFAHPLVPSQLKLWFMALIHLADYISVKSFHFCVNKFVCCFQTLQKLLHAQNIAFRLNSAWNSARWGKNATQK